MSDLVTTQGFIGVERMLRSMGPELLRKELPKATKRSVKPMTKAMRRQVKRHTRTKQLWRAMGSSQTKYSRDGIIFQAIGIRRDFQKQATIEFLGRQFTITVTPTMYGHLLHEGTAPHRIPGLNFDHPGTQGIMFSLKAFNETHRQVSSQFAREVAQRAPRTARRLFRRGRQ